MDDPAENPSGRGLCLGARRRIAALENWLGELEVPIAEGPPYKLVQAVRRLVEAIAVESRRNRGRAVNSRTIDPTIDGEPASRRIEPRCEHATVHLRVARGIPQLGNKIAVPLDPALGELDVATGSGQGGQRETQGITAILVDQLQRIDDVAARLRHLLSLS